MFLFFVVLYLSYQSYHVIKVKTLFNNLTVKSIYVTISARDQNSEDYFLTNTKEIQKIMNLLTKANWDYRRKELKGGYSFSQTISWRLYSDNQDPITVNFLDHKVNFYVTIWGKQDYGVYIISSTEGQKIIDTLPALVIGCKP